MKICFWGDISNALSGNTSGGGELQQALLAKALTRSGHEVVVIDYQVNEKKVTEEGIKIYPVQGWDRGIKMIRTITHRIPGLYRTLRDQKADIYYCRIRDSRHFIAWLAARKVKGKFVLGIAADLEIMSVGMRWKYYYVDHLHSPWVIIDGIFSEIIYPWLLRRSDAVLVQHTGQQNILNKKGISSRVFMNLIDISLIPAVKEKNADYFAFVGWLDKRKGIVEFYHLVKNSPDKSFRVIGPPRDKTGYRLSGKMESFPHVTLFGKLGHADTLKHIAGSRALINTSPLEGFPNIFIEAWACGIPVVSLNVDPGSVIEREGLGKIVHGNLNELILALSEVNCAPEFAEKAKEYVENNHVINNAKLNEINRLFTGICDISIKDN